jgi:hypothetical protein
MNALTPSASTPWRLLSGLTFDASDAIVQKKRCAGAMAIRL